MKKIAVILRIGYSCFAQNEQTFGEYTLRPELFFGKTVASFESYSNIHSQLILGMSFEKKNLLFYINCLNRFS